MTTTTAEPFVVVTDVPDVELLQAAVRAIIERPDEHEQGVWRCGTGMCLFGWIATVAGAEWATRPDGYLRDGGLLHDGLGNPVATEDAAELIKAPGRQYWDVPDAMHVRDWVKERARLTDAQVRSLSCGFNDLDDIEDMVARLRVNPADQLLEAS